MRIRANHSPSNRAPAWIATAVPAIAGKIDASNKIAWDARIHSRTFIAPRVPRFGKRIPFGRRRTLWITRILSCLRIGSPHKCSVLVILKWHPFSARPVARGYRRKRFYSTPIRVLTHLSSIAAHEPGTLSALTQEGIASATHSGRTTATKWLARMESTGLIAGERAHVPGHRVRKTVYRLTHEGWVEATKLRGRLQGDIVEVLAPGLDPTPMRVAEIPEIFPAYVNLTAAVSLVRGGRLDFTRLHGIGSGAVPPVLWGDTLRRLGRMFGRSDDQQALDTWASSQVGMLIVTGIAGIGKSTVVASWLVRQRPRPYIYWFEIHEGTTNSAFLRDLAAFLARLGKRGLTNLLREQDEPEPRVLARLLVHEL